MNNLEFKNINKSLMEFLDKSPNHFYAVKNLSKMLDDAGAIRLREADNWELEEGKKYYVVRNGSAIIAFTVPKKDFKGFQMIASHSDSPVFKIKANADISVENEYVKLNVEKYGGMILSPWLDRPLSVAGRLVIKTGSGIESRLINIDRDLLIIPNLAIHMNRDINNGMKYNVQTDLLPLFSQNLNDEKEDKNEKKDEKGSFLSFIAKEAGVDKEDILDTDLYLYNRMKATCLGKDNEFIASGRLDDLQCAYASMLAFVSADAKESAAVCAVLDNEEVGSNSKQGADGTFLQEVVERIDAAFSSDRMSLYKKLKSSFLVSADNAHAVHPNHPEKADPTNRPYINKGIVIKYAANQSYTTDAISAAVFKSICEKNDIPYQTFTNRSDMLGGSTLGNICQSHISVNSVDIGLPQFSMHSPYETAGARDTAYLFEASKAVFNSSTVNVDDDRYDIV